MSAAAIKLVGVDPGFASFGASSAAYGADGLKFRRVEVWHTEKDDDARRKADDTSVRIRWLTAKFMAFVAEEHPIAILTETQASGGNTCPRCNPQAKFRVQTSVLVNTGRVRGMIDAVAELHGIPVIEEAPQRIKIAAAGANNASKLEVAEGLERLYPGVMGLFPHYRDKLKKGDLEHASDACAVIHCSKDHHHILTTLRDRGIIAHNDPRLEVPY